MDHFISDKERRSKVLLGNLKSIRNRLINYKDTLKVDEKKRLRQIKKNILAELKKLGYKYNTITKELTDRG